MLPTEAIHLVYRVAEVMPFEVRRYRPDALPSLLHETTNLRLALADASGCLLHGFRKGVDALGRHLFLRVDQPVSAMGHFRKSFATGLLNVLFDLDHCFLQMLRNGRSAVRGRVRLISSNALIKRRGD